MKKREIIPFDRPEMDGSMKLYQPSIIDEEIYRHGEDGSLYLVSDIEILKKLNVDSSEALANSLANRMQIRPSSTDGKDVPDAEIFAFIKSRDAQTNTELAMYRAFVEQSLEDGMSEHDIAEKIAEMRESEKTEVEQPQTE